jgi:hypothetical protein
MGAYFAKKPDKDETIERVKDRLVHNIHSLQYKHDELAARYNELFQQYQHERYTLECDRLFISSCIDHGDTITLKRPEWMSEQTEYTYIKHLLAYIRAEYIRTYI